MTSRRASDSQNATAVFYKLHDNVSRFLEKLEGAISLVASETPSIEDVQEKLTRQKQTLESMPPLNLVVVGSTKAGKSTLVNAMLSRNGWKSKDDFHEILPRRLLAETNAFWRVETSTTKLFEFQYHSDHRQFDSYSGLATYIQNNYGRGAIETNSVVTIRVPRLFTSVCGGDFCLIDSPGLSEAGFPHDVHTFLQDNPHILIYVLPITAGCLTTIDDQFLSNIFKSSKIQKSSTCVFVLTCFDRALGEADKEEVAASIVNLSERIEDAFGAKAFPTSCLVLQRGTFLPNFTVAESLAQIDELLKYIEKEFLRNSKLVVLKSIFSATQEIGYNIYDTCVSYHKVQYRGKQTQRMFALFDQLEAYKGDMVDRFRQCLEGILQPPESPPTTTSNSNHFGLSMNFLHKKKHHVQENRTASNLREHIEMQIVALTSSMPGMQLSGLSAVFKRDFWDRSNYQNRLLEHLRPSIKSYIVVAVVDVLKSICLSFLQLCRAEIIENARASLDPETFKELCISLDAVACPNKQTGSAGQLGQLLSSENKSVLSIATAAVDKLASQATSRALFMIAKYNPIWQKSTVSHRVAQAVTEQLGANSSHFFNETKDITTRLLDDLTRAIKRGVQDYYRNINAELVLQRHPQLRALHELLQETNNINLQISRLEAFLEEAAHAAALAEAEEQEKEAERLAALKNEEAELVNNASKVKDIPEGGETESKDDGEVDMT